MNTSPSVLAAALLLAALVSLTPPAQAGFAEGAVAYIIGEYPRALKELMPLAEQGDAPAQNILGQMYANGHGVPQDYAEAVKWYRKAAEQGDAPAQNILGEMYAYGRGVPRDDAQAVQWYRKAAEQGFGWAQYNLGEMYENGRGVHQNKILAYALYNLAAANKNPLSANKARGNRDRLAEGLSREALLRGQELARQLAQPGNFAKALDAHLARAARK